MTNECLHPGILNIYIFFRSPWQSFQVTWYIDQKSRKLPWNNYVPMCVQGKIPLETSLDQMGKQL